MGLFLEVHFYFIYPFVNLIPSLQCLNDYSYTIIVKKKSSYFISITFLVILSRLYFIFSLFFSLGLIENFPTFLC